jgi:carboxyl-terminal processing protease
MPDIAFPDILQTYEDLGESSLDGALPWDTVRPVEYSQYYPIQDLLPELTRRHEERANNSADFIYLRDQIERSLKYRERTTISLNEEIVKAEREESRREEFDAENMRRLLKGLPLREWVDEESATDSDIAATASEVTADLAQIDDASAPAVDGDDSDETAEPEETDPLLLESGYILVDLLKLTEGDVIAAQDSRISLTQ